MAWCHYVLFLADVLAQPPEETISQQLQRLQPLLDASLQQQQQQLQQQLQLQQPGVTAMHLQLSDANLTQLAAHIPHVVKLSGAELQLTAGPQGVGRAAGVSTGG